MRDRIIVAMALFILIVPGLTFLNGCLKPGLPVEAKAAIIDQLGVPEPNQAFIDNATTDLENYSFKEASHDLSGAEYRGLFFLDSSSH